MTRSAGEEIDGWVGEHGLDVRRDFDALDTEHRR